MKIIGITGGKGGTGKSTIATALAVELGKKFNVLLVDMDVDCPNDHLILNIKRNLVKKVNQRIPKWNLKKCNKCGLCGKVCKQNAIVSIKGKKPIFMQNQCNGCGACLIKCPVNAISWINKEIGMIYRGNKHSTCCNVFNDFCLFSMFRRYDINNRFYSSIKHLCEKHCYD